ncbi:MAG: hypothetical protein PHI23_02795 [Candidatus Peribacteraceae bacterium]|nr:hypothetical protein [Candidatus Peribacteraceae bacterium]
MAKKCHYSLTVVALAGVFVGTLISFGASRYAASLVSFSGVNPEFADTIPERDSGIYRNNRSIRLEGDYGIDAVRTTPRPATEGVNPNTGLRGAATTEELPQYCPGTSTVRRSRCIINYLNGLSRELEEITQ